MNILCLDTVSKAGSLTLSQDSQILVSETWERGKSHSEVLLPSIDSSLKKINWTFNDIHLMATNIGPGSFTGVRVALNFTRTVNYISHIPLITYNSLFLIASQKEFKDETLPILVMLNAFKRMLYIARYSWNQNKLIELTPPIAILPNQLHQFINTPHLCLGDGYDLYAPEMNPELKNKLIRPKVQCLQTSHAYLMIPWACQTTKQDWISDWNLVFPLYIRASEAEEKLEKGLLKTMRMRKHEPNK